MPLMGRYSFDIVVALSLTLPMIGMIRDLRNDGQVHPAWWRGVLAIAMVVPLSHLIANSPVGDYLYTTVTAGQPGATIPPWEFGSPPPAPS